MVVQGSFVGGNGSSAMGKRDFSSTISSNLPKNNNNKKDGQLFGKSKLKRSTSSLLFPESPSLMETSELMSIRTVYDASSPAQSLNMFLLRSMKTLNISGGQKKIPV